jgi:DNA mismatch repair protein MutS2
LVELDAMHARLQLSEALGGLTPRLHGVEDPPAQEKPEDDVAAPPWLQLLGMRHPLMVLAGTEVVANDIALDRGVSLIISGPNAGGKTVALKTIGLCVLLAQVGIRVPTSAPAEIPLFARVVTDVGDDQSISANLSTFSAHIHHVREAIIDSADCGAGTLVLFDEIAVGTDPTQGAALAEAILLHLAESHATVITTTHYDRLKLLSRADPTRFLNAAVGFDLERMAPTFRVTQGVPGASSALALARRLGLPEEVLAAAEQRIESRALKVEVLLQEISSERDALHTTRERLERERLDLQRRTRQVEGREQRLAAQAKSRKMLAYDDTTAELRALKGELSRHRKALRRQGVTLEGESGLPEVEASMKATRAALDGARERPVAAPGAPPRELAVGDRVYVSTLAREGEVVAFKGKQKVIVQLENLRTTVSRTELRPLDTSPLATKKRKGAKASALHAWTVEEPAPSTTARHFGADAVPVTQAVETSVDIRGTRMEEAIRTLDAFVDEVLQRDRDLVLVVHGHGSGVLRSAVREHLERQPHVRRVRAGVAREGGDGVTVVWLDGDASAEGRTRMRTVSGRRRKKKTRGQEAGPVSSEGGSGE